MRIEQQVLDWLVQNEALNNVKIETLLGHRSFVAVQLSNRAVGTAMNYGVYPDISRAVTEAQREIERLRAMVIQDSCLYDNVLRNPFEDLSLTAQAAKIAILSALSQPFIEKPYLNSLGIERKTITYEQHHMPVKPNACRKLLKSIMGADAKVGIVGFGGLLEILAEFREVAEIHIVDKHTGHRADMIHRVISDLNRRFDYEKVRLVGSDIEASIRECDVVCITASSLCNGTMDLLLRQTKGKRVIVQGPSGALVPFPFFDAGVDLMCIEVKDARYISAYHYDERAYDWFTEFDNRTYIYRS